MHDILNDEKATDIYLVIAILKEIHVGLIYVESILNNDVKIVYQIWIGPHFANRVAIVLVAIICLDAIFFKEHTPVNVGTEYRCVPKIMFPPAKRCTRAPITPTKKNMRQNELNMKQFVVCQCVIVSTGLDGVALVATEIMHNEA